MDRSQLVMLLQHAMQADPYQNKDSTYQSFSRGYGSPTPIYERDAQGNLWVTQNGIRKRLDARMIHANKLIY
jgi:hypothetical protein